MPGRPVTYPETTPVLAVDIDGHRQVMHDLTGIAPVGLQQHVLSVTAATNTGAIIEQSLAPAFHQIHFGVTGGRVGKIPIVGWHVAIRGAGNGEDDGIVGILDALLHRWQHLVSETVEGAAVLLGVGVRDRLSFLLE